MRKFMFIVLVILLVVAAIAIFENHKSRKDQKRKAAIDNRTIGPNEAKRIIDSVSKAK